MSIIKRAGIRFLISFAIFAVLYDVGLATERPVIYSLNIVYSQGHPANPSAQLALCEALKMPDCK